MLQSALSTSGRADSLYEYCEDDDIFSECRRLGFTGDELSIVRLKQRDLRHVKAVGTTGKRSVMLSVVVALALEDGGALGELWRELRDYNLDTAFVGLLRCGRQTVSKGGCTRSESPPAPDGVELEIVCERIPVLGLEKASIFQEYASWLLQTAMSSSGKADALYEYCDDREIITECNRLGLGEQDVGLVRLKQENLRNVKAVGTSGKRSTMLALVV